MKINTATISASEAAYFLQKKLGSLRAWGDFLSDNIRDQQSVSGLTLLPCARLKSRGWQTRYAIHDVQRFIRDVLALGLIPEKIKPVTLAIERCTSWKNNKFDKGGTSCRHQACSTRPRTAMLITA